ncbi:DUF4190 domain-containing protein [Phytohabitans flavus]|uniref:DUF4190 domain-containing protein n=1 Tax=Phytohabitans flavus TaxID=1076124 RepID=UPI0031EBB353
MTEPPPYGYQPPTPPPTSGAPQQPDAWGQQQPPAWGEQQPSSWGQQPPPGQWGQPQADPYGQQQQPGQWGQPATDPYGQQPPQADPYGQQPPPGQWGQQPDPWGQQAPGQWGQQPAAYPPPRQGTNGFAIASLIFGVLGGILLSVIFGIVALSQVKRKNQGGKGLAIGGLALSGVWLLAIVSFAVIATINTANDTDDPSTSLADGNDVNVQQLAPGQCLNGLREGSAIRDLPVVPCTQPHEGEVFAVFELPGGGFPGDEEVAKQAEDGCVDRLQSNAPKAAEDPTVEIYFLHPTRSSWRLGDQGVTCVAMSSTGKVTGSIND